jgi:Protein of unknown function (DUF3105)
VRDRSLPPALRRAGIIVALVLLALGGIAGALLFFASRDQSKITPSQGPGQAFADQGHAHVAKPGFAYNSSPPTSGPHAVKAIRRDGERIDADQLLSALELGNVVILYPGSRRPPEALRALQDADSGPLDPALLQTGNQVVLARYRGVNQVVAAAWRHLQPASSPSDPRLKAFVDFWLGRPLGG